MAHPYRYAYLHGFASSPLSKKGVALEKLFSARGLPFERPDLNRPSFAKLSHNAMLGAVDETDERALAHGQQWRFIGSSLGGWLAARWAELHPERVDRLLLLCPGFHLADRWPHLVGDDGMARWEREGELPMEDATGELVPVHWGFYEESKRQPAEPAVPCPTRIIHGTRDETVPIDGSRRYAQRHDGAELVEVDDDHALMASLDRIAHELTAFFELG
ncbi:MAG: YqiA/YcfP family alpha/beta fold hydrolase [Polyangiales bacterium]